jgi:hypothetical protein
MTAGPTHYNPRRRIVWCTPDATYGRAHGGADALFTGGAPQSLYEL